MRIAIAQMGSRAGSFAQTVERMLAQARVAASQDARLIAYPAPVLCGCDARALADDDEFFSDCAHALGDLARDLPVSCRCAWPLRWLAETTRSRRRSPTFRRVRSGSRWMTPALASRWDRTGLATSRTPGSTSTPCCTCPFRASRRMTSPPRLRPRCQAAARWHLPRRRSTHGWSRSEPWAPMASRSFVEAALSWPRGASWPARCRPSRRRS